MPREPPVTSATLPPSGLSRVVFTGASSLCSSGGTDRQESAAAHRQVLRLRRDVVRTAAEDFTAADPGCRALPEWRMARQLALRA